MDELKDLDPEFLFKDASSGGGGCPGLYRTADTFVMQGWQVSAGTLSKLRQLAGNESAVEFPANLIDQIVEARRQGKI